MEFGVVAVCFCFGGLRGAVSFRAVKGEAGPVSLGVAVVAVAVVLSVFVLGGRGACQLPGCEGGRGVVVVCFCFGGAGGQSALEFGGVVVGFFSGGRGPVSFFRLACPTFDTCQEVCSVREGFCQEGILSGRNFVRQEFCQAGILSGRNFVRKRALPGSGLCQETGSARKESQLWSCVLSSFGGNGVKNWKLTDAT